MVTENPATLPHYLTSYFPIKPSVIDKDRRKHGDYQHKPTQYWFVNCKPEQNIVWEPIEYVEYRTQAHARSKDNVSRTVMRSMMHPQYARWFIQTFLLDRKE